MFRVIRLLLLLAATLLLASCGRSTPSWNLSSGPSASVNPSGSAMNVVLKWNAVAAPNLTYRVYYGTASRSYLQPAGQGLKSATNTYTVTGLASAARYYFAVTTTDSQGNESALSSEVFVDIP
jgi:fibronectin type 3 domain-containing protein